MNNEKILVWDMFGEPHHVRPAMAPTVDPAKITETFGTVTDGLGRQYLMVRTEGADFWMGIRYRER